MKKNRIAITFLLSITVVFLFIPLIECQSESILTWGTLQEGQLGSLFGNGDDAYALLKTGITFKEEIVKDFSLFSLGRFSSFCMSFKIFYIFEKMGVQLQVVYAEQSPRSPPFFQFP